MARTPSTMRLAIGAPAPVFQLPDAGGKIWSLQDFVGKPLLLIFACNHCPYVIHVRGVVGKLADQFTQKGGATVAVNSNDSTRYPDDAPALMPNFSAQGGWHFPYLWDEEQSVAKAYHAACTPDFFLFDSNHRLFYRGQMDDSRPGNGIPTTGINLEEAIAVLLSGEKPPTVQKPSLGCSIKWKPGNEPKL